jgi:hypothetical protein
MEATESSPFFARPSVLLRTESGVVFDLIQPSCVEVVHQD